MKKAIVFSSLDEALFTHFGGNRLADLVKKMGYTQGEVISHKMITSSIRKAQEKIAAKAGFEQAANSQAEWFQKNG